jgi:cbb3-type cytochrome oxidase maturation protein
MSVILVLILFSVTLAGGFLIAFFWSVRDGQYDDPYGSSVRILFEDEKPEVPPEESHPDTITPKVPSPKQ